METYEVSTSSSADVGITKVNISGTITGLASSATSSKYTNAATKFSSVSSSMHSRCQTLSGLTLNVLPLSSNIGRNKALGTISYSYEYDTRPSNVIAGALSESITVTDVLPTDYCVPIFVLGRPQGPVLQNLNTSKETTRALSIEIVVPVGQGITTTINDGATHRAAVQTIIDSAKPTGSQVYVQDKNESWDMKTGRYSYNTTWIWEA